MKKIALFALFLLFLAAQLLQANSPPDNPPAPAIVGSGTPFSNGSAAYCNQNCPPYPVLDPDGDTVSVQLAWFRNGVRMDDLTVDSTKIIDASSAMIYRCTSYVVAGSPASIAHTCAAGDTLQIKAMACDDNPAGSECTDWVGSNIITVEAGCSDSYAPGSCDPGMGWDGGCCWGNQCIPDGGGSGACSFGCNSGKITDPFCQNDIDCCFGMACLHSTGDPAYGICGWRATAFRGECWTSNNDCAPGLECCLEAGCGIDTCNTCGLAGDPCSPLNPPPPPNRPPNPPALSPHITSIPSPITASGVASCDGNCPPATLPTDPDGDTVHMEYLWYKNTSAIGAWGAAATNMDCSANGCGGGDIITLRAKACDDQTPGLCSSEVVSNPLTVQAPLPPPPPVPVTSTNTIYPILAVVIAFAILGLAYMASYVFGMASLRAIVQDEVLQVIATGAIAAALIGANGVIDTYMVDVLKATGEAVTCSDPNDASTCDKSMMGAANGVLLAMQSQAGGLLTNIGEVSTEIGKEASRGIFCNFLGVGYTLVNCSQLNAFRGGLTTSAFATSTALADTYAQQFILSLARTFSFTFLLPIGLFLRCFKVSRQAGGALIAIGFGFYTAYPAVIVAMDKTLHGGTQPTPSGILNFEQVAGERCDPAVVSVQRSYSGYSAYATYITEFSLTENIAYFVLVRVLFSSILSLIITLGFIRAFAHIIGSEIDVSALARIS